MRLLCQGVVAVFLSALVFGGCAEDPATLTFDTPELPEADPAPEQFESTEDLNTWVEDAGGEVFAFSSAEDNSFSSTIEALKGVYILIPAYTFSAPTGKAALVPLPLPEGVQAFVPQAARPLAEYVSAGNAFAFLVWNDNLRSIQPEPGRTITVISRYTPTRSGRNLYNFEEAHVVLASDPDLAMKQMEAHDCTRDTDKHEVKFESSHTGAFAPVIDIDVDNPSFYGALQQSTCYQYFRATSDNTIERWHESHFDNNGRLKSQLSYESTATDPELTRNVTPLYDANGRITEVVSNDKRTHLYYAAPPTNASFSTEVTYSARQSDGETTDRLATRDYERGIIAEVRYDFSPLGSTDATMTMVHNDYGMLETYAYVQGTFDSKAEVTYDDNARIKYLRVEDESGESSTGYRCKHSDLVWDDDTHADLDTWTDNCEGGDVDREAVNITFESCSATFVYWYFIFFELELY